MFDKTSPIVICVFGVSAKIGIGVDVMVIGSAICALEVVVGLLHLRIDND